MSDISTLHQRLNRLVHGSAIMSGQERILVQDGETDVRCAMRAEIAETQLPRRVTFRNSNDDIISFEVVAGRVIRLVEPTSASIVGRSEALLKCDDPLCLPKAVSFFAQNATRLSVETERLDKSRASLEFGIAMDTIFEQSSLSGMPDLAAAQSDVVTDFLEASRDFCTSGLVLVNGLPVFEFGSEAILTKLNRLAERETVGFRTSQSTEVVSHYTSQCVVYSGHPIGGQSVICVSHTKSLGFATVSNDALGTVIEFWKSHAE